MSLLFIVEGKVVKPHTETLLISPFREIWDRDSNPGKFTAVAEFSYIEFMTSVKKSNPYGGYDEQSKKAKVNIQVMGHEEYEPDELVIRGMKWLIDFQKSSSPSYNYYMAAKKAAEKMQDFFNDFSMNELNPKTGNPQWKPKDITAALNDTAKVLENLNSLKDKVDNELFETVRKKGDKVISPFADPENDM